MLHVWLQVARRELASVLPLLKPAKKMFAEVSPLLEPARGEGRDGVHVLRSADATSHFDETQREVEALFAEITGESVASSRRGRRRG